MAQELDISEQAKEDAQAIEDFIVDEPTDEVLRLHLDRFEGPFEVLLYLIRSQEIDIFDIPIMRITEQYLKFLDMMREENLDVAGEYLVMAATLIQIKSKMILPMEQDEDEEEEIEEDPRLELVEKLIAYRKYRDVTERLEAMAEDRSNWFTRNAKPKIKDLDGDDEEDYIEATLFDLAQAFKNVSRFLVDEVIQHIEGESVSVDDKIDYILSQLDRADSVAWVDLFKKCRSRDELLCSFLAILELCRMRKIRVHQHVRYGDMRLFRAQDQEIPDAVPA